MAAVSLDLMSSAEIARLLGVSQTYVNRLAQSGSLPAPQGVLSSGQRVWFRNTIQEWAASRVRMSPAGTNTIDFPPGSTMARIQRTGHIRIGVTPDLPGFALRRGAHEQPEGLEVDVANFIAAGILGDGTDDVVELIDVKMMDRTYALTECGVDLVIANFAITEPRMKDVAFAGAYMSSSHAPLVADESLSVDTVHDLAELRVAVNQGTTDIISLLEVAPGASIVELDGPSACLDSLRNGTVDAYWSTTAANIGFVKETNGQFSEGRLRHGLEHWAVAVPKRDDELQNFVSRRVTEMFASGAFARSASHWLGLGGIAPSVRFN